MDHNIIDPRTRYPDLSMSDTEARNIMEAERHIGRMLRSKAAIEAALVIERADEVEFSKISRMVEKISR